MGPLPLWTVAQAARRLLSEAALRIGDYTVLFFGPPERGAVDAIQHHFGSCYSQFSEVFAPGDIAMFKIQNATGDLIPAGTDRESQTSCRIIAPVHINTVRAAIRRTGAKNLKACPGSWYEILCD